MRAILHHRPSPALVIACIALAVALGGTSYAAITLPKNSVGTAQLKKNAVTSPKVKNNAITGADVLESSLARVPAAENAAHATNADHATSATTAGTANEAFSRYHANAISLPDYEGPILALYIPPAGNYVITAKFIAINFYDTASPADGCRLSPGDGVQDHDFADFHVDAHRNETVSLQLVHRFADPAQQVVLYCTDQGVGAVTAAEIRITAVQVAQLTYTREPNR
jgi:hypothetical protein